MLVIACMQDIHYSTVQYCVVCTVYCVMMLVTAGYSCAAQSVRPDKIPKSALKQENLAKVFSLTKP